MATSRGLNPGAPAYIPLSYTTNQTPLTNFPPPQPCFFFPTASLSHLYTTHRRPPPPPVVETPPVGTGTVRIGGPRRRPAGRVVTCGPRGSSTASGFLRSSSSSQQYYHQKEKKPNFGSKFNSSRNNKFGSTYRVTSTSSSSSGGGGGRNGEWRRLGSVGLKKHEVLPLSRSEEKTSVMIKNIPKLYNRELLLKFLDEHCLLENRKRNENSEEEDDHTVSAFDFVYLPIDFRTGCCRGFAFVNFTEAKAVWKFLRACNRKTWDLFQSLKIREIVCAKIQGKEALVKHFDKSTFHCESDEFLPVSFSPPRDGSGTELVEETRIGKRISSTTPNV